MTVRVRPSILFGGIGLLVGFLLGLATANHHYSQYMEAMRSATETAASPARVATLPDSGVESVDTTFHLVTTTGRPARGPDTAPVTIVEFTDYECPYCRKYFLNTLPLVFGQYGDRVRYVVMNYPIPALHPDALSAAEAAECAADQGRFWDYHDQLFLTTGLDRATLGSIAARVHLDSTLFARCVDTRATAARVQDHMAQARALGVRGTPTFFINGRIHGGAPPAAEFKAIIDSAAARASH